MTRSSLQRGPEKGHYHDTLGVAQTGTGLPEQWGATVDGQMTATADSPDEAVLTVKAPAGAELAGDLVFEVQGETGRTLFSVDAYGNATLWGAVVDPTNGGGGVSVKGPDSALHFVFAVDGAGVGVGQIGIADGDTLGFFGKTPATQPAAPVTLTDVINALKTLGLVAS